MLLHLMLNNFLDMQFYILIAGVSIFAVLTIRGQSSIDLDFSDVDLNLASDSLLVKQLIGQRSRIGSKAM